MGKLKKKILIVNRYFLPGFKAGGPIQSLKNMCDALRTEYDIFVITLDKDFSSNRAYHDVVSDSWNHRDNCSIYYHSGSTIPSKLLSKVMDDIRPDVIYLNSFFDPISINAIRVAQRQSVAIVLAPRGEFSEGALQIKWLKKKIFLILVRSLNKYSGITYHATTALESDDIQRVLGDVDLFISENLVKAPVARPGTKEFSERIKLAYISRITPKKNLLIFLEFLKKVELKIYIDFSIYGPIDDSSYWSRCLKVMSEIPGERVSVNYKGAISHSELEDVFDVTHFTILLTSGENFGHSIYESLAHGVPVIISDKTPWLGLEKVSAGFNALISMGSIGDIFDKIELLAQSDYHRFERGALALANEYYESLDKQELVASFDRVIACGSGYE